MNTRQMTVVLTVAAIALVFIGIGFAYTAFTANQHNSTDVAYVTLTQADNDADPSYSGAYQFANNAAVRLDTFNEDDTTTVYYALNNSENIDLGGTTYRVIELGIFDLVANYTGEAINKPAKLDVGIPSSSGFNPNDGWAYFLSNPEHNKIYAYKCTSTTTEQIDWIDGPDALTMTFGEAVTVKTTVTVLFGHITDIETITKAGMKFFAEADKPAELVNGALIFKADSIASDASGSSTPLLTVTYDKNGGIGENIVAKVLNGSSITLKASDTFTPQEGQQFSKWKIGENEYAAGAKVSNITADTTIKAVWVDNE